MDASSRPVEDKAEAIEPVPTLIDVIGKNAATHDKRFPLYPLVPAVESVHKLNMFC